MKVMLTQARILHHAVIAKTRPARGDVIDAKKIAARTAATRG